MRLDLGVDVVVSGGADSRSLTLTLHCVVLAFLLNARPLISCLTALGSFPRDRLHICFFLFCLFLLHSEGGFLSVRDEITGTHTQGGAFSPILGSRVISYADDDTVTERNIYDIPDYSEPTSSPAPQVHDLLKVVIQSKRKKSNKKINSS